VRLPNRSTADVLSCERTRGLGRAQSARAAVDERAVHLVDVAAEDSIVVEAQLRCAAYCAEITLAHP